jgi:hypothetical protein
MRVELHAGYSRGRFAYLRPLNGHDELGLDAESVRAGTWLLERLLTQGPDAGVAPASLGALDMGNRDRLLRAVFDACFGDRIDGISRCSTCGVEYQFNFTLAALAEQQARAVPAGIDGPDEVGFYRAGAVRFRLPTVADVDSVRALPATEAVSELLRSCVDGRTEPIDENAIEQAMDQLAPSCDLDIDTHCPSCAQPQTIAFSLESFLLRCLAQERRFLTAEIHRLAAAYGWGLDDILSLSRDDRRTLVRQVEHDRFVGARR